MMKPIIAAIEVNNAELDLRSLKHDWWLYNNLVTGHSLPLPTIARIIPVAGAHWNGYKSSTFVYIQSGQLPRYSTYR